MPKLKRALGLFELTFYGVGIILGAGIYVLIGKAAGVAGNVVWISFALGAIIASFTGLSYAELGTIFPREAAECVYSKRAFRSNLLSFLIGWVIVFTGFIAAATVSLGFGGYFFSLTGISPIISAIGLILIFSFLNFWGIKESARFNVLFTLVEMTGLLIIIFLGIKYFGSVNYFEAPFGVGGIFSAAILIFFAYLGFEDIVNLAEETKNPIKLIPKAIIISILVSTILYVLVSISAVSILPWDQLGRSSAPLADVAATSLAGSKTIISFIALFATANTVLIILIVTSRMLYGMAKEKILHNRLAEIHSKTRTPWISILLAMIASTAFVLIGNIKTVAEMTDFFAFIVFLSVNLSLIWLRFREPNLKRPFKVPINIGRFPILPALGALVCVLMLTHFKLTIFIFGIAVILSGVVVYKILNK